MARTLSRRDFLTGAGSGAVALVLAALCPAGTGLSGTEPASHPLESDGATVGANGKYEGWQDLYRHRMTWDRRVRCTHIVNCWYQRNCSWEVYVKDGLVLREEQTAAYPAVSADVPDFNPRGCQKGACYSALLYSPDRLLYPLRRVGDRGAHRWKRVTWDEALAEIADRLIDAVTETGPDSVVLEPGGSLASTAWRIGVERMVNMLDGVELDTNTELDDGQAGAAVTMGTPVSSRSADDFFRSDVILIWGANPVYTQIPNAHFLNEARYRGARVVTIAPDYSASSVHCDLFVPVRPGTDAALALAIAHVMLASDRIDHAFVRSQTDLPFLVREDNGRFLRESDTTAGGREDAFFAYDEQRRRIVPAPERTLDWGDVRPALSGRYEIDTLTGRTTVRPVLDVLRERLDRDYTPEKAAEVCGISPSLVRRLAEWVADAKALSGVAGSSLPKLYHGDLIMRAQLLVFMLGGHIGRPGAGFDTCPFLRLDGIDTVFQSQLDGIATKLRMAPKLIAGRLAGQTTEQVLYGLLHDYMDRADIVNSVLYWRRHAGLAARTDPAWGRTLPRPVDDYVRESYEQQWQREPPATPPRVLLVAGSNLLRRIRSADLLLNTLWPKIDLVVTTEIRMSTTALWSDILLPAATSYEKDDVPNWLTLLSPYLHITQAAVPPLGESKVEWEIHALLARRIQHGARERGIQGFLDRHGELQRLDDFYDRFTDGGRFSEDKQTDLIAEVVRKTSFVDASFDAMRETGYRRVTGIGGHPINLGNATDVAADSPAVNRGWRVRDPAPWPTLTRRIQFYIDHPFYLELGEQLPVHKEPPRPGGEHPLVLTGGHTRWSIHGSWRNLDLMLQLQRGEAAAFVARADAEARGIADGDRMRVFNDTGDFVVRARVSDAVRPGTVILYHAWEDHQFPGGQGYRNVLPSPLNPIELAGGYTHLRPAPASLQPGQSDRETRVDIARA
jgi:DMSO reductase family type II enzyme molybdopterin subunit